MPLDTLSILGRSGGIARRLDNYEHRPEQLEMAEAVQRAIDEGSHLIVEAGTGVGKSFAYLVPAILTVLSGKDHDGNVEDRKRLVISTNTISLQEQLTTRDIPFLNAVLPVEFSAVLVKGRSNYISLRRLKGAVERAGATFARPEELDQLQQISSWSRRTGDGSLSDLEFRPLPQVWDEVESAHGNCLGKKCPTHNQCFYYKARRRIWNADLLVVNHALFFADLALRREGANILPDYDVVIFDEAHCIESVAADHLGLSVSSGQLDYLLNKLYNDRTQRGLLLYHKLVDCQRFVTQLRFRVRDFFADLNDWQQTSGSSNGRVHSVPPVQNALSPLLKQLASSIALYAKKVDNDEQRIELTAASDRCLVLADDLERWLKQSVEDSVYWIEISGRRRQITKLVCAPLDVGPVLRDELFNRVKTAVLTSATLAVGGGSGSSPSEPERQRRYRDTRERPGETTQCPSANFAFIKGRLGLTKAHELKLGGPFDYRSQVKLILPDGMPNPAEEPQTFESAVCEKIKRYVAQTAGRAFVLFTSYSMMRSCASRLTPWLAEQNLALYSQGEGLPRTLMLERFRNDPRAVLFGTDSFWQGVDVPGEALQNVIITKLPFSVPDHPLLQARLEAIKSQGGNPFMEYQVPEAVIKLKQGFGRLIRRKTDTGQVVILDPRIRTKRYGRLFLDSLPECNLIIDSP